jgi:tripartite-type tricarboxylate transporter receptor subunit TctC
MRRIIRTAVVTAWAAVAIAAAVPSLGQAFPVRPVRIVVPFTPGSLTDVSARLVATNLTEMWGQQVVIDNRSGAGGTIGTNIVAEANPDGYTLLAHSSGYAIAPALYPKWKVDMLRDFQGISTLVSSPHVMTISPKLGPKNLQEFLAYARKLGERFSWAHAGVGSGTHFAGELFMTAAKLQNVSVAYKGLPEALLDSITGRVNVFFAPLGPAVPFIRDGRALALAVTSKARSPVIPDVPTVAESAIPGFEVEIWFVLSAPSKTPRPIVDKISADVQKVLQLQSIRKTLDASGVVAIPRSADETQAFLAKEIKVFAEVARTAKIPTF